MPRNEEPVIVNGKPLSQYVAETEAEEEANRQRLKGKEIAHTRKDQMHDQDSVRYYDTKTKMEPKRKFRKYEKNSKVVKLPDDRIRKEYGIMSKPLKTVPQNVIWLMIKKGPITARQIADELGKTKDQIYTIITTFNKILPENNFTKKMVQGIKGRGAYAYSIVDLDVEECYDLFKLHRSEMARKYHKPKKAKPIKVKRKIKRRKKSLDIASSVGEIAGQINEQLNKLTFPSEIKITIDIRFGFIK
jgi:hypothetical protein